MIYRSATFYCVVKHISSSDNMFLHTIRGQSAKLTKTSRTQSIHLLLLHTMSEQSFGSNNYKIITYSSNTQMLAHHIWTVNQSKTYKSIVRTSKTHWTVQYRNTSTADYVNKLLGVSYWYNRYVCALRTKFSRETLRNNLLVVKFMTWWHFSLVFSYYM